MRRGLGASAALAGALRERSSAGAAVPEPSPPSRAKYIATAPSATPAPKSAKVRLMPTPGGDCRLGLDIAENRSAGKSDGSIRGLRCAYAFVSNRPEGCRDNDEKNETWVTDRRPWRPSSRALLPIQLAAAQKEA